MADITVKVLRRRQEAQDIASFELGRPDGAPLPAFSAGSHIDVHVPGGLVRQYSLCNDAGERHHYRIAVLRDPATRGGSAGMHDAVQEGDLLTISEPRNHFPLVHARRTVLLAGGIGVTPLLCMAQRLAAAGAEFTLHYCTRSPERTAFRDEIAAAAFASRVRFHFDDGEASQKLDLPAALGPAEADAHVYVCGPAGFIDHVVQGANAAGFSPEQIHLEYFGAAPQDTAGDRAFDVKLASSGQVIRVAADQTVVQALAAQGVEILTSCEQGVCGTCITRVLSGECDHRDLYFTDEEKAAQDQFTPCCSRARSAMLVLDL
ncbi:MAG TPA: PDR/VanB family oxidoreductase [Ramlibacter sp.]|jgi:vanillate O-demethylase ferredoxin subunit|uniref:PDR/VanB family oxidoreductase n=1 Tax=Ramlibacter sp. TaxID=1917967 RepID=UPI002D23CC23|nr:PDR/VanB family oxidoreductase [Ramlibacter sp.]HZY17989.1 PDR/VanB family oxidoreductase [Ramlibacter sp.]